MATKSEKGELARIYFLMCERALVQSVKANEKLKIERAKGIAVRKSLTDVIRQLAKHLGRFVKNVILGKTKPSVIILTRKRLKR